MKQKLPQKTITQSSWIKKCALYIPLCPQKVSFSAARRALFNLWLRQIGLSDTNSDDDTTGRDLCSQAERRRIRERTSTHTRSYFVVLGSTC